MAHLFNRRSLVCLKATAPPYVRAALQLFCISCLTLWWRRSIEEANWTAPYRCSNCRLNERKGNDTINLSTYYPNTTWKKSLFRRFTFFFLASTLRVSAVAVSTTASSVDYCHFMSSLSFYTTTFVSELINIGMQLTVSLYFHVIDAAFAVLEHLLGRQLARSSLASHDSQVSDPCSRTKLD